MNDDEQQSTTTDTTDTAKKTFSGAKKGINATKNTIGGTINAVKKFMKLPLWLKLLILKILLVAVIIIVLIAGAIEVLDILNWENTKSTKEAVLGTGASYSEKVVSMQNGKWKFDIKKELKQQLIDAGINIDGMTQDEMLIRLLIINGIDTSFFSQEQLQLLPYLIKSELSTQQMDLRPAEEMYDEEGNYKVPDINSFETDEIQGTVHIKRVNSKDMSEQVLSYMPYNDFKAMSDATDLDKVNDAKKYFSFNDENNLVIYTWGHVKMKYISSGSVPKGELPGDSDAYYITETTIDYKPLVNKYTLPFEVLTALLVTTEDCNFTKQVANLAFESNIEISLMEEYENTVDTNNTNYYETIRGYQYLSGTVKVDGTTVINEERGLIESGNYGGKVICEHENQPHGERATYNKQHYTENEPTYTITEIITTETNNYKYSDTFADTWFLNLQKQYRSSEALNESDGSGEFEGDYVYYTEKKSSTGNVINNIENAYKQNTLRSKIDAAINDVKNSSNIDVWSQYGGLPMTQSSTINVTPVYDLKLETVEYKKTDSKTTTNQTKNTWTIQETTTETDLYDKKGEKFLKALDDNEKARILLDDIPSWLFEKLDEYDSNFTTIIKYLLYKHKGLDVELDLDVLEIFGKSNFSSIGNYYTNIGWEFTKGWENNDLRKYRNGETTSYSGKYIVDYVTEDGKRYICYNDQDGNDDRNYGYGVKHFDNGYVEEIVMLYSENGVEIKDYGNIGDQVEAYVADAVGLAEWNQKRDELIGDIKAATKTCKGKGIEEFTQAQLDAMTDKYYNGWTNRDEEVKELYKIVMNVNEGNPRIYFIRLFCIF
ncbi:MAG: hypothetical protein Q4G09_05090 [Clostridia bacterium]|nr:hypothetical protein [Clostridia bacterium]